MNKLALFLLGIAAAVAVTSSSKAEPRSADEKVTGLPETKRLKVRMLKPGETTPNFRVGPAEYLLDGQPVRTFPAHTADLERARELSRQLHAVWDLRKTLLPQDAKRQDTDAYSKELYWLPSWITMLDPNKVTKDDLAKGVNGSPIDEFGRKKPGLYGDGPKNLWDQTFGGLLKNPLFKTVVIAGLVASGPQGAAIYGAYTMWEARGKEFTPTNALLIAGRSYAVSQCGPGCGVAFDFGVGVASGKSVDRAAEDALYKEMTPAQQDAFRRGKALVKGMS